MNSHISHAGRRLAALGATALIATALAACGSSKTSSSGGGSSAKSSPSSSSQGSASSGGQTATKSGAVKIVNYMYMPPTITVAQGAKVSFANQDSSNHTATADNNSFDSGNLNKGQSKTITFSKPGTIHYHCSFHPFMHGTIVVK